MPFTKKGFELSLSLHGVRRLPPLQSPGSVVLAVASLNNNSRLLELPVGGRSATGRPSAPSSSSSSSSSRYTGPPLLNNKDGLDRGVMTWTLDEQSKVCFPEEIARRSAPIPRRLARHSPLAPSPPPFGLDLLTMLTTMCDL